MTWFFLIVLALLVPEILSTVLDSRLGRAVAVRLEAGTSAAPDDVTAERLRYLEAEVDRLSEEVRRLTQQSEFLHELLTARSPDQGPRLPPGARES